MIKWKSLFCFIITITVIIAVTAWTGWHFYGKALGSLSGKHPELFLTPKNSVVYVPNYNVVKGFKEFRSKGYSLMLPPDFKEIKIKDDPCVVVADPLEKWVVRIYPKMMRFDETIQAERFIKNPSGDYFILTRETLKSVNNPFLLFQKMSYVPSYAESISEIKTPSFFGFLVEGKDIDRRVETYTLFDEDYWHNITVSIYDESMPKWKMESIISTLKNDESSATDEEEKKDIP